MFRPSSAFSAAGVFAVAFAAAFVAAFVVAFGSCKSTTSPAQQTVSKPNILFLFADDQRPDAVGAFGNEHIETPNIDRIVRAGFRFRNNYCMGSWGGAVCVPSRAMLMSGRTMHRVKANLQGVHTMPQALAGAGYVTYGTGKWHNKKPAFERSFRHGKNIMFGGMSDHTRVPITDLNTETREFSKRRIADGFSSTLFADTAVEYLEAHARAREKARAEGCSSRPFFLYVAFTAPHDPRNPPVEYRKKYHAKLPPLPKNFMPQCEWFADKSWGGIRDEVLAGWPRTEKVIREQLAEYYGLITHMDDQIGRILKTLEATGQADNTIIVYAADHGLAMGSHGLTGKQNIYEHSTGCPLVFSGPGIPKGQTSPALTYLFDIYPTLCSMVGAKIPDAVEGKSLAPIVHGEQSKVRGSLFTLYRKTQRAVRDERYKLIRFPEIDKTLLFDLQADPDELNDLSEQPAHKDRVASMRALLEKWQLDTDDQLAFVAAQTRPAKVDLTGRKRKADGHQPRWIVEKYFDEK